VLVGPFVVVVLVTPLLVLVEDVDGDPPPVVVVVVAPPLPAPGIVQVLVAVMVELLCAAETGTPEMSVGPGTV
jgi:hypothetical protein